MKAVHLQIVHQGEQIIRTGPRLHTGSIDRGTSKPSPVVRDNAVASRRKRRKLVLPHSAAARRRMYEDDGHSIAAGIFVREADTWQVGKCLGNRRWSLC